MTTGTVLVQNALKMIGAHSVVSPANVEAINDGGVTLVSMLEMWLTEGVNIGFTPIDAVGNDINEPPDTTNGIESNLAVLMLPKFPGVTAPAGLFTLAATQKARIFSNYRSLSIPKKRASSTLPLGSGNDDDCGTGCSPSSGSSSAAAHNRHLTFPPSDTNNPILPAAADRANKIFAFGLTGQISIEEVRPFYDVATLLADTITSYDTGTILRTQVEGFSYVVADPSTTIVSGYPLTTSGGVKLFIASNESSFRAFGAVGDSEGEDTTIIPSGTNDEIAIGAFWRWISITPGAIGSAEALNYRSDTIHQYTDGDFTFDCGGCIMDHRNAPNGQLDSVGSFLSGSGSVAEVVSLDPISVVQDSNKNEVVTLDTALSVAHSLVVGDVFMLNSDDLVDIGYDALETRGQLSNVKSVSSTSSLTIFEPLYETLPTNPEITRINWLENITFIGTMGFLGPGRKAGADTDATRIGYSGPSFTYCKNVHVGNFWTVGVDYQATVFDNCYDFSTQSTDHKFDEVAAGSDGAIQYGTTLKNACTNGVINSLSGVGSRHLFDWTRNSNPGVGRNVIIDGFDATGTWREAFGMHGNARDCTLTNGRVRNCLDGATIRAPGWTISGFHGDKVRNVVRLTDDPKHTNLIDITGDDVVYGVLMSPNDTTGLYIGTDPLKDVNLSGLIRFSNVSANSINLDASLPVFTEADGAVVSGTTTSMTIPAFSDPYTMYNNAGAMTGWDATILPTGAGGAAEVTRTVTHTVVSGNNVLTWPTPVGTAPTTAADYVLRGFAENFTIGDWTSKNCDFSDFIINGNARNWWVGDGVISHDTLTAQPTFAIQGTATLHTDSISIGNITSEGKTEGISISSFSEGVVFRNYLTIIDFGAVGDGVTDDSSAIDAAISSGMPLNWEGRTYAIASSVDVSTVVDVDWVSSGATVLNTSQETAYMIVVRCTKDKPANLSGSLTIDGNNLAPGGIEFRSDRQSGDALDTDHNLTLDNLHVRRIYRKTNVNAENGISVRGGWNLFTHRDCSAVDLRMADGAEVFGSKGIFGITAWSLNTHDPRHIVSENWYEELIRSERKGYLFDQDGQRYFGDLGTTQPSGATSKVIGGKSINTANRAIKFHSRPSPIVTNFHIEKDDAVLDLQSVALDLPASHTFVLDEVVTQAVTGATGVVIDGNTGAGDPLITSVSTVYLQSTSSAWDTTNTISGSSSGIIGGGGVPTAIAYNETGNPDIDFQQAAGTVDGLTFLYKGMAAEQVLRNPTERDDQPFGGGNLSGVRGFIDHVGNNMTLLGVGEAVTGSTNLHAVLSDVVIVGSFARVVQFNVQGAGKNTLLINNVIARVTETFVNVSGTATTNPTVTGTGCRNISTITDFMISTVSGGGVVELGLINCTDFNEDNMLNANLEITGNNPTLSLIDSTGGNEAAMRSIDGTAHFYNDNNAGGVSGGFDFRVDGTAPGDRALLIGADKSAKVYGDFEFTPGSSVTPTNNGDAVFEATSDTTLTVKLKGSDSAIRSGAIALTDLVGDGVTDDGPALQAAIDAAVLSGDPITLAPGNYLTNQELIIDGDNTIINGAGSGSFAFGLDADAATVITAGAAMGAVLSYITPSSGSNVGNRIEGLKIIGANLATLGVEFQANNPQPVMVDVKVLQCATPVILGDACWGPRFDRVMVNFSSIGFDLRENNHNAIFEGCVTRSDTTGVAGVRVGEDGFSSNVNFYGCDFEADHATTAQVYIKEARAVGFFGSYIEGRDGTSGATGITLGNAAGTTTASGVTISGCYFQGLSTAERAILFNSVDGASLTGNHFRSWTTRDLTTVAGQVTGLDIDQSNSFAATTARSDADTTRAAAGINELTQSLTLTADLAEGESIYLDSAINYGSPMVLSLTDSPTTGGEITFNCLNSSGGSNTVQFNSADILSSGDLVLLTGERGVIKFVLDGALDKFVEIARTIY